jgi:hypothetical protein
MYYIIRIAQLLYRQAMGWTARFESWQGQEIFPFSIASRPALGPAQSPIQWVPGALSLG